jgi:hypothetical protein
VIIVLLAIGATSAAVLARQVRGGEDVKTIDVTASRFQFEPETISVAQETPSGSAFTADRSHAFCDQSVSRESGDPEGGETVTVEFIAERAGHVRLHGAEYCVPAIPR